MTAIPLCDFRRVVASASLMGSPIDGEALGATRAVCRVLGKHRLEPAGVIANGLAVQPFGPKSETSSDLPPMPARWSMLPLLPLLPWERKAKQLLSAPGLLSVWERGFLVDVAKRLNPSPKQLDTIDQIAASVAERRGEVVR